VIGRAPQSEGSALLAGLLRCRRCGRKLMVAYTGNGPFVLRYVCHRSALDNGEPPCITFAGLSLDEHSREILIVSAAAIQTQARERDAWRFAVVQRTPMAHVTASNGPLAGVGHH